MSNDYRDDYRDQNRGGRGGQGHGGRGGYGHGGGGQDRERRGIPLSELDPTTTDASRKVIGCSIEVHKALGPGYDAKVYAAALKFELDAQGVKYQSDYEVPIKYKDKPIGMSCADLYVENLFLVAVAARPGPVGTFERMALRGQLKAADLDLGLIINFSERRLKDGLVRVLNIDKINLERGGEGPDQGHDGHDGHDGHLDPEVHDFESGS